MHKNKNFLFHYNHNYIRSLIQKGTTTDEHRDRDLGSVWRTRILSSSIRTVNWILSSSRELERIPVPGNHHRSCWHCRTPPLSSLVLSLSLVYRSPSCSCRNPRSESCVNFRRSHQGAYAKAPFLMAILLSRVRKTYCPISLRTYMRLGESVPGSTVLSLPLNQHLSIPFFLVSSTPTVAHALQSFLTGFCLPDFYIRGK